MREGREGAEVEGREEDEREGREGIRGSSDGWGRRNGRKEGRGDERE